MSQGPMTLSVGRSESGYVVRVRGRGTMRESRVLHDYLACVFGQPESRVVVDLAGCEYLDSTFLGCLVTWRKKQASRDSRFLIAAPADRVEALLTPLKLNLVFEIVDEPPPVEGSWATIDLAAHDPCELGRHVMECHRRLAELGGPQQEAFTRIADGLERDLNRSTTTKPDPAQGQSVPS